MVNGLREKYNLSRNYTSVHAEVNKGEVRTGIALMGKALMSIQFPFTSEYLFFCNQSNMFDKVAPSHTYTVLFFFWSVDIINDRSKK